MKIKQGLVFQNDEPINADAVVFTFKRAQDQFAANKGDLTFAMRQNQGEGYRDLIMSSSGPDYTCQGDALLVEKNSGSNRMSWVDDKFETMFNTFVQDLDQSKWQKECWDMEAYAADQAPVVWMYTLPSLYGVSQRLGFAARGDGRMYMNLVLKGVK